MSESLKKGVEALLFLASRKSAGVTEVAERLGVHKSTAFRVLHTLLEADFVEKSKDTSKYKLGPVILQLSERYYKNFGIIALARPIMRKLAQDIGESVHLCIGSNNSAVVIEQIMFNSGRSVNAKIGHREPLHCSSVGKCLLAFASEEDREEMLNNIEFEVYTDNTISNMDALKAEIAAIKKRGYAADNGELDPDVRCVAVPVIIDGACAYTLGASSNANRFTAEKLEHVIPLMQKAAKEISEE